MKKLLVAFMIVAVVVAGSLSVYAYGGRWNTTTNWQGRTMTPPMMQRGHGPMMRGWSRWNTSGQVGTAPEMVTEDKAKEAAEAYISQYLPGYAIDTIEKDSWRPVYIATITGENNAEMVMMIHGFGGQVMHVFPKTDTSSLQQ
jgi:hypothetical protein